MPALTDKAANPYMMNWSEATIAIENMITDIIQMNHPHQQVKYILGVGKGGIVPAALLWQIFPDAIFRTIQVRTYPEGVLKTPELVSNSVPPEFSDGTLNDPGTIVVDDICDSGATFEFLHNYLPKAQFACVLARANTAYTAQYVGKTAPGDWWVHFPWEAIQTAP